MPRNIVNQIYLDELVIKIDYLQLVIWDAVTGIYLKKMILIGNSILRKASGSMKFAPIKR